MAAVVLPGRLGELSAEARIYPAYLLPYGGTALCLFAARFYGVNDAIHFARQRMAIDLVDTSERVFEMAEIYEDGGIKVEPWHGDAWGLAQSWSGERKWDAVSCDTFTGDPMTRSLASLGLWCSLANEVVTVTHTPGAPYEVPDGWDAKLFTRNTRVNWLVLTRE